MMKNPPHPGETVRYDCLEPLGLNVTQGAKALGVSRQALNNLVNGKAGISPEMAIRLSKAFGGSAETWLRLQLAYDLARAREREHEIKVERVKQAKSMNSARNWTSGKKSSRIRTPAECCSAPAAAKA